MGFIMTAEGHLLFSLACAVFAKNAELTPVLAQGDWWHIVPSAVLTCLLPDIDHPKSLLGQRRRIGSRFRVGPAWIQYPGDPAGPPAQTINCRCWLEYQVS